MTAYLDVVYDRQVIKETDILKCAGDSQTGYRFGLFAADGDSAILAGKYNLAPGRLLNPGYAIKEGCLAGAVRSDQSNDLVAVDVKTDIFKGLQAAKAFVKLFYF
jgi:hypothetical protein